MPRNEALELVKTVRKLLDNADPRFIHWDKLKKEMDDLIAKEEARPKPLRVVVTKPAKKRKKGGKKDRSDGGLDYSVSSLKS